MTKTSILDNLDFNDCDFMVGDVPDLHRVLERLRSQRPYAIVPLATVPAVLLLTHDLVSAAFKDEETFPASALYPLSTGPVLGKTLQCMAGTEHRKNRALVAPAFRRRQIADKITPILAPLAHELIDRFADRGTADLVAEFTTYYPALLISRLLGLPVQDEDQIRTWAHDLFYFPFDPPAAMRASTDFTALVTPILADRRKNPRDDLISVLVTARIDAEDDAELAGESLSDEEVLSFLRLLFPAGADTTMLALGNTISALLTHPDQMAILLSDIHENVQWAIWEGMRWEPPVGLLPRACPHATTWNGIEIPAQTPMIFSINAAHRDPAVWPDPHRFDITRRKTVMLSFGQGPHSCVGNWLALAELQTALKALIERLPGLRFQDGAAERGLVTSQVGTTLRGPNELAVQWDN
ncbi:cytochrome P450 [Mycolicibacterium septicum]|uniref:Cytochrome P450 n=1 Tax=Mycolicibacterium septicum TaxID=98668 RepID=A0ABW9LYH7_9MYCO